jgi:hypothetical protein
MRSWSRHIPSPCADGPVAMMGASMIMAGADNRHVNCFTPDVII